MERLTIAVLSFLALFATGAANAVASCPSEEDVAPCTCTQTSGVLRVVCTEIKDSSKLASAFKALRGYQLSIVRFNLLNITDALPNDLFDDVEITDLKIENSDLKFAQPVFTGLENSLKELRAFKSVFEYPKDDELAKLVKLEKLIVSEVPIGKITDKTYNGKIPNVRELYLDKAQLTDISSKAFAELQYLTKFSASHNGIKEVARTLGPRPALHLESIDFSWNEISELPDDAFAEIPNLRELRLMGNKLKTLSKAAWFDIWESRLYLVDLFDNNLECDEEMDWLKERRWPEMVEARCVAPSALVGKHIREVYKS